MRERANLHSGQCDYSTLSGVNWQIKSINAIASKYIENKKITVAKDIAGKF